MMVFTVQTSRRNIPVEAANGAAAIDGCKAWLPRGEDIISCRIARELDFGATDDWVTDCQRRGVFYEVKPAFDYSPKFTKRYGQRPQIKIYPETGKAMVQPTGPEIMTDADILKRLVDTGFIAKNERVTNKVIYRPKKPVTALDVFDEITKMTGSETRARNLMRQNMSGVSKTLDTHRPKKNYTT